MNNLIKRTRTSATKAVLARGKEPARPKAERVTYSFNLDDIRDIRISTIEVIAKGIVVTPPRPRPFTVELTIERTGH